MPEIGYNGLENGKMVIGSEEVQFVDGVGVVSDETYKILVKDKLPGFKLVLGRKHAKPEKDVEEKMVEEAAAPVEEVAETADVEEKEETEPEPVAEETKAVKKKAFAPKAKGAIKKTAANIKRR
jgi:hypothetical protein